MKTAQLQTFTWETCSESSRLLAEKKAFNHLKAMKFTPSLLHLL